MMFLIGKTKQITAAIVSTSPYCCIGCLRLMKMNMDLDDTFEPLSNPNSPLHNVQFYTAERMSLSYMRTRNVEDQERLYCCRTIIF